jgi:multimeric flavodoxin WrbA
MYILGIGGSPRNKGLSDSLLDVALQGARSEGCHVEKIVLNELSVEACQDCGQCSATGACVVSDDLSDVRAQIDLADGVIIASPVYFASVTAQLKTFIDRFQDAWISKYVLKRTSARHKTRKGVFLCVSGEDKVRYFENSKEVIKAFFATLDIEYSEELFLGGSNNFAKGSSRREEAMKKVFDLGAHLARSL